MWRNAINYLSVVFAVLILLLAAAVAQFWPASYWMDVRSIRVFDAKVGEPILMAVDRTIVRDFPGQWVVTLRQNRGGKWIRYCAATGTGDYQVNTSFPDPLTLSWWTYPGCQNIEAGEFVMRTTWTILRPGLPDKTITVDSNIFKVTR